MTALLVDAQNETETLPPPSGAAPTTERFRYMPFLDGLRGISILMVLGFHGMGPISHRISGYIAGWSGVDIFFVISGFLITSILLQERNDFGTFSLRNFYVRRCLRIWPAYYFYLAVVALTGYANLTCVGIAAVYLTNYELAFGWNLPKNLPHLWSLAVEEQFYLIWPLALYLAGRRAAPLAITTIGAVWIWRTALLWSGVPWLRIAGAFDTRLDCILYGCLAAIWWLNPAAQLQIRSILSGRAVPFIVAAALACAVQTLGHPSKPGLLNGAIFWIIRMPTFHILTAVLILSLLVHARSPVARVLSFSPLVWLGRLSYSLYLWHGIAFGAWPKIEAYLPTAITSYLSLTEVGRLAISLFLALISYYLIEMPFLILKKRWASPVPARVRTPSQNPRTERGTMDSNTLSRTQTENA